MSADSTDSVKCPFIVRQPRDGTGTAFVLDRSSGANVGYVERMTWESANIWDAYVGTRGHYRKVGHRTTRGEAAALVWEHLRASRKANT